MRCCADCGEEIPSRRLEAVPGARHCVDCAAPPRVRFKDLPGSVTVQHGGGLHEKYLKEEDIPMELSFVRKGMARTLASMAMDVGSRLSLSKGQFDVLCAILHAADDPESKARELNAMDPKDLLGLIGEKRT